MTTSDTAIFNGALIIGLSKKDPGHPYATANFGIDSRVACRHHGTMAYDTFIQGRQARDESLKEPSPFSAGYVVPCKQWCIEKNTNNENTKHVVTQTPFFWEKSVLEGSSTAIEARIYVSEKEQAPLHMDKRSEDSPITPMRITRGPADVSELVKI
ncbi:hypothetical protein DID88_007908 [Monilinia fructigena]|uniref:Uncharacterized protein n=1 Tax=Monilinia fructigena TaxID=38457 RepID=A0A395J3R5_9HELO|nr:hypothetical protein DID88_007908 [Monilinia fructigena]